MGFLKQMLSGSDGIVSSKRTIMFLFTLLFCFIVLDNHFTKRDLDATLKQELFYLLIWLIAMVFGEQIPAMIQSFKGKGSSDDQAKG